MPSFRASLGIVDARPGVPPEAVLDAAREAVGAVRHVEDAFVDVEPVARGDGLPRVVVRFLQPTTNDADEDAGTPVDEPVAGMTHQETERTAELLTGLAGEHTVVVVEHDMDFVRSIARRVTVLHMGSVLAEGRMETVQADPKVLEVYLGH